MTAISSESELLYRLNIQPYQLRQRIVYQVDRIIGAQINHIILNVIFPSLRRIQNPVEYLQLPLRENTGILFYRIFSGIDKGFTAWITISLIISPAVTRQTMTNSSRM